MSMLSIQIDKLRKKADMLDSLEGMHNLVPMLRDAADTIESLRDRAQTAIKLERENERLRRAGYEVGYHDAMKAVRSECKIYRVGNTRDVRKCSACGKLMHFDHPLDCDHLNFCPNCGCKVVKR